MNAQTMEAGRELDALVAERVQGYAVQRDWLVGREPEWGCWDVGDNPDGATRLGRVPPWRDERQPVYAVAHPEGGVAWYEVVPFYSTDIAAAWEVVEAMGAAGWCYGIDNLGAQPGETDRCAFWHWTDERGPHDWHAAEAPTTPLAICRAALAALEAA